MDEPKAPAGRASIESDPYSYVLRAFCARWKPFIIHAIAFDESTRFNRFMKQLPITEKVLASNLRELESDGIVSRTVYPEVPPRVEYRLTEPGRAVVPILDAMYRWGWEEMTRRELPVDPLGEMWHGYRERDEALMSSPYKGGPGRLPGGK